MADYHIYIHEQTGKNKRTSTKKSGKPTTETTAVSFKDYQLKLKNVGKVAGALAAAKVVLKSVETVEKYMMNETGDFRFQRIYGNYKQILSIATNPTGMLINNIFALQKDRLQQQKNQMNMELLGDSYLNNRYYGV